MAITTGPIGVTKPVIPDTGPSLLGGEAASFQAEMTRQQSDPLGRRAPIQLASATTATGTLIEGAEFALPRIGALLPSAGALATGVAAAVPVFVIPTNSSHLQQGALPGYPDIGYRYYESETGIGFYRINPDGSEGPTLWSGERSRVQRQDGSLAVNVEALRRAAAGDPVGPVIGGGLQPPRIEGLDGPIGGGFQSPPIQGINGPIGGGFQPPPPIDGINAEALIPPAMPADRPGLVPPSMPDMNIVASTSASSAFPNRLPESLEAEIREAKEVGARPIDPANEREFAQAVQEGTIKFVVTQDGKLLITPKYVHGREISHPILSNGQPVLTAGQADIAIVGNHRMGLAISNDSGHFQPTEESLDIAKQKFAEFGITFP